ncbi:MAG: Stk1 family PASTA domain-containing Ser/Thr kinase [Acidimicrobiales bacterium]
MSSDTPPAVYNGRYELVRLVARGGMAEVYLARDLLLDRPVALKVLFPELSVDRTFVARFRREAQAAANLSHQNIVPVYDWGESDRTYFIVMEYIDGRPLSNLLRSDGPMPADQAAAMGAEVASALAYAHRQGVIHRDVKPGNVLISDDGNVKVADFGIARAKADESLTQTGAVMGTATYFSPEQAQGEVVDSRSDVYSLGVVLYEAISGAPPFSGENPLAIAYKHVREEPARLTGPGTDVPPAFEAIVFHALAKDPAQRYQDASELRDDLLRFQQGAQLMAPALTPVTVAYLDDYVDDAAATTTVGAAGAGAAGAAAAGVAAGAAAAGVAGAANEGQGTTVMAPVDARANPTVANPALSPDPAYDPGYGRGGRYDRDQMMERSGRTGLWALLLLVLLIAVAVVVYLILHSAGLLNKHHTPPPKTKTTTAPLVKVPSEVGSMFTAAQTQLQGDGFKVSQTKTQSSQPSGTVTAQSASGQAPKGSTITLTVSSGPATVSVPDVHGDTASQAGAALQQANLGVGSQTSQGSTTVPAGQVISTHPPANTSEPPGTKVNLVISSGQPTAKVPDVTTLQASVAETQLSMAGFKVAKLTYQTVVDPGQDGAVISESPTGTQPVGATITLTVGQLASSTSTSTPTSSTTTTTGSTTSTTGAGGGGGGGLLGGG